MSTFKNPFYRGETAIRLLQHIKKDILKRENLKGVFNYKVESCGETGGFQGEGWAYDLLDKGYLDYINPGPVKEISIAFEELVKSLGSNGEEVLVGFKGCFDFLEYIFTKQPGFKKDLPYEEIRNLSQRAFSLGVRASYGGKAVAYKYLDDLTKTELDYHLQLSEYFENAANQIAHLKYLVKDKKYTKRIKQTRSLGHDYPYIENKRIFLGKRDEIKIYRKADLTIIRNSKLAKDYIFLNKDLTRISQMLRSIALIIEYFYFYPKSRVGVNDSITVIAIDMVAHILKHSKRLDADEINNLCRAYNVAVFKWLADLGADLTDRSSVEMQAKIDEEDLERIGGLSEWFNMVKKYAVAEQAELLHIYKFIYVGDFCLNSAMEKFRLKHYNVTKVNNEELYQEFLLYRKMAFIRYYRKEKGRMPGAVTEGFRLSQPEYEALDPYRLKLEDMPNIDLNGCLDFEIKEADIVRFAKDKVTQPVEESFTMTSARLSKAPIHESNYLAGFLLDPKLKDAEYVLSQYRLPKEKREYQSTLRTALKPEAKKRDARLFTMANRYDRLMISMIEDNIDRFIRGKNGVFTGLSHMDKKRMFRKFVSPIDTMEQKGTESILISFDLKGFSPLMDPRVKKDMYEHWANLYDRVEISNAYSLFEDTVYMQRKFNFDTQYKLQGNDIEGFNARMGTDFHVDLMAFAVYKMQKERIIHSGARLAVLIDDGFLKLIFKDEITKEEVTRVLELIEEVYEAASMKISWDKTIVSKSVGIFLNEIVYNGAFITPGIKSYMKIGPDKNNNIMTFAEELNEIYGNAQGAISAGCSWLQVYYRYLKEVFKSRFSWDRRNVLPSEVEVIRAITPVNLGGFGVAPLITLASNESQSQITTNISFLRAVAMLEPKFKKMVVHILNQEKKETEPITFLRNPATFRIAGRLIHNKRIDAHVKEIILSQAQNPVVLDALDKVSDDKLIELFNMLQSIGSVDTHTIERAYNSTPEALIDTIVSKFQRSTTFATLLPARVRFQVMALNISDVKGNTRHWKSFT